MNDYITKPVVQTKVKAKQFTGKNYEEMCLFCGVVLDYEWQGKETLCLILRKRSGNTLVYPWDWITIENGIIKSYNRRCFEQIFEKFEDIL
jgi:hypothetical protein